MPTLKLSKRNLSDNNLEDFVKKLNIDCDSITSLSLSNNNLHNLQLIVNLFPKLKFLRLENNNIENIDSIIKLKHTLEYVDLSNNNIKNVKNIDVLSNMKHLTNINLSDNKFKIETDEDINIINKLCDKMIEIKNINNIISDGLPSLEFNNIYYSSEIMQKINNRDVYIYISGMCQLYQDYTNHPMINSYTFEELINFDETIQINLFDDIIKTISKYKIIDINDDIIYELFEKKSNYNNKVFLNFMYYFFTNINYKKLK